MKKPSTMRTFMFENKMTKLSFQKSTHIYTCIYLEKFGIWTFTCHIFLAMSISSCISSLSMYTTLIQQVL